MENSLRATSRLSYNSRALIVKLTEIVLYFIAFMITLNVVGVDLTALAVFGGALGVGIGFGLQKITSNFFSGIILLVEKSIKAGDLIEIASGTTGTVKQLAMRYTLIETADGREVMIPNEDLIVGRVTNWTYTTSHARIDITIGVAYEADMDKARALMIEAATEHPRCIAEPAPNCFMREFADSSVNFMLIFWVDDVTQGRLGPQSDVMFSILRKFAANRIEIPYPQREMRMRMPPSEQPPAS
jgi:small-conductance mechanosensitive channel